jgi:hypothetical protein
VQRLVVDAGLPQEFRPILEAAGVAIHIAPAQTDSSNGKPESVRSDA